MGLISNGTTIFDAGALDSGVAKGAMTLIKTVTLASAAASISFVDGASSVVLDGTYKEYIFYLNNIHPASASTFTFNLSIDTGSNYNVAKTTTAFQAEHAENDGTPQLEYRASDDLAQATGYQLIGDGIGAENDNSLSGFLHLFEPSSTTFVKHFIVTSQQLTGGTQHSKNSYVVGYANTTSAVDAIDFKMASGNIDAGSISLYGVN
jgi:hypothetical protein